MSIAGGERTGWPLDCCAICRFWGTVAIYEDWRECHCEAPIAVRWLDVGIGDPIPLAVWGVTPPGQWCGRFEPRAGALRGEAFR